MISLIHIFNDERRKALYKVQKLVLKIFIENESIEILLEKKPLEKVATIKCVYYVCVIVENPPIPEKLR
jgi:hypothetical protein